MPKQNLLSLVGIALLTGLAGFLLGKIPQENGESASLLAYHNEQPLSGRQQPTEPSGKSLVSRQPQPTPVAIPDAGGGEKAKPPVSLTGNRLSIHIEYRLLENVLQEISDLSEVPIISEGLKDYTVSSHFENLPLDEGLRVLLQGLDAFFLYGNGGHAPTALQAVWVYPQGKGRHIVPTPPETWASTAEMRKYLYDPDPEMRARAAETLIDRHGKRASDAVLQALQDGDEKVRYRTLAKAVQAGSLPRGDVLQHLMSADSSPVVRFLALEALTKASDVSPQILWESANVALNDTHDAVREQAQTLLDELEPTAAPSDPNDLQTELQERSGIVQ